MAYAHALIEVRLDDDSVVKYDRGEEVPSDIPGYDELVEAGSIRDEDYDPDQDKVGPPPYVEIDGVRYERQTDTAEETEDDA
jgi:hypothetical protein